VNHKITPGIPAGIIGATILGFYGMTMKAIGFTDRIYLDFAKVIIMSQIHNGMIATIVGWAGHLTIGALFGILMCYFISATSSRFWILKGWGVGISIWFVLLSFGKLFDLPLFYNIPPKSALTLLSGSSLWGLTSVYVLKIITNDFKTIINRKLGGTNKIFRVKSFYPAVEKIDTKSDNKLRLRKPKKLI